MPATLPTMKTTDKHPAIERLEDEMTRYELRMDSAMKGGNWTAYGEAKKAHLSVWLQLSRVRAEIVKTSKLWHYRRNTATKSS